MSLFSIAWAVEESRFGHKALKPCSSTHIMNGSTGKILCNAKEPNFEFKSITYGPGKKACGKCLKMASESDIETIPEIGHSLLEMKTEERALSDFSDQSGLPIDPRYVDTSNNTIKLVAIQPREMTTIQLPQSKKIHLIAADKIASRTDINNELSTLCGKSFTGQYKKGEGSKNLCMYCAEKALISELPCEDWIEQKREKNRRNNKRKAKAASVSSSLKSKRETMSELGKNIMEQTECKLKTIEIKKEQVNVRLRSRSKKLDEALNVYINGLHVASFAINKEKRSSFDYIFIKDNCIYEGSPIVQAVNEIFEQIGSGQIHSDDGEFSFISEAFGSYSFEDSDVIIYISGIVLKHQQFSLEPYLW